MKEFLKKQTCHIMNQNRKINRDHRTIEKKNQIPNIGNRKWSLLSFERSATYNISHKLLTPSQFLEKLMKIFEWSRNKLSSFCLLNVAAYWKSSNTEACAKNLPHILANNTDNGGRQIGFRIYVRYYRYLSGSWLTETLGASFRKTCLSNTPTHAILKEFLRL